VTELRGGRVLLRDWRDSDLDPWAEMNADPEVMEYFPARLDRAEADAMAERIRTHLDEHRWGLWALEVPGEIDFAGFVGLAEATFEAHFTPAVEVGWRLARPAWGHGYASEAARLALGFAFDELGCDEVVSFTAQGNLRSRAVMERIDLSRDPADDFDHPRVEPGSPLRRHVLYRTPRPAQGASRPS